jgi:hypothetical protein
MNNPKNKNTELNVKNTTQHKSAKNRLSWGWVSLLFLLVDMIIFPFLLMYEYIPIVLYTLRILGWSTIISMLCFVYCKIGKYNENWKNSPSANYPFFDF